MALNDFLTERWDVIALEKDLGGMHEAYREIANEIGVENTVVIDSAAFNYTEEQFEKDIAEIARFAGTEDEHVPCGEQETPEKDAKVDITQANPIETIKKLAELRDYGILTQEEFDKKKMELLAKI